MPRNDERQALMVGGFAFAFDPDYPANAFLRLSATEDGPHWHFVFDAPTLDRLADAMTKAAADIRKKAS